MENKETLEEAAFRMYPKSSIPRKLFIRGAKWQAERMYSEEDLRKAFLDGQENVDYNHIHGWSSKLTEQQWFNQFKKK
jgi:hypothetical protein